MAISYRVSLPELAVLAHFCGGERLPGFPPPPALSPGETAVVLESLAGKGMVSLKGDAVLPDGVVGFLMETLTHPELLLMQEGAGLTVSLSPTLGLLTRRDRHAKGRYSITPLESPAALAEAAGESILEDGPSLWQIVRDGQSGEQSLTLQGLEELMGAVYRPVERM